MLTERCQLLMRDKATQRADSILEFDQALIVQVVWNWQVIVRAEHVLGLHRLMQS